MLLVLSLDIKPRLYFRWASLVAQMVKDLPTMQEIQVKPLGQQDLLEKGMATHSSILAWTCFLFWEADRLQSWQATIRSVTESDVSEQLTLFHFHMP